MKRVLILVEGHTEERFTKDVLRPHLWRREVDISPTITVTKRVKRGPDFKGGVTHFQRIDNDLRRLLGDSNAVAITTFLDYYGLPSDFPGMNSRPAGPPVSRAVHIESEWAARVGDPRFRPHLAVHEFEAMLFADPNEIGRSLNDPLMSGALIGVRSAFTTPEEIDDHPETAPSKRILGHAPGYQKAVHGPIISQRIGLEVIRSECPHFDAWLRWVEGI